LFNITGGEELSMYEIDEAAKIITKSVDPEAKIKFGAVIDPSMGDAIKVTVIATGFDEMQRRPSTFRSVELEDSGDAERELPRRTGVSDMKREEPMIRREEPVHRIEESPSTRPVSAAAAFRSAPNFSVAPVQPAHSSSPSRSEMADAALFSRPQQETSSAPEKLVPPSRKNSFLSSTPPEENNDDELDIPAFIRKKMK
jgi:cell division protein FtsZ